MNLSDMILLDGNNTYEEAYNKLLRYSEHQEIFKELYGKEDYDRLIRKAYRYVIKGDKNVSSNT